MQCGVQGKKQNSHSFVCTYNSSLKRVKYCHHCCAALSLLQANAARSQGDVFIKCVCTYEKNLSQNNCYTIFGLYENLFCAENLVQKKLKSRQKKFLKSRHHFRLVFKVYLTKKFEQRMGVLLWSFANVSSSFWFSAT